MQHLVFVIHKHDATSLHYDFRLQIGSVMSSWAIPKGPTLDSTMKRLAMETTDHSLEYRNFEGVISEGRYGAGPVMIWDEGIYTPEIEIEKGVRQKIESFVEAQEVMKEGRKKGELKFVLHGKKLKGSFALIKTRNFGPKNSWLLIKHKDEFTKPGFDANDPSLNQSVVSKRTLQEIAEQP